MSDYAQAIISNMAEMFMRHDYRAMWDLFETQVIPILQATKDVSGARLRLVEMERDEERKEVARLRAEVEAMKTTSQKEYHPPCSGYQPKRHGGGAGNPPREE